MFDDLVIELAPPPKRQEKCDGGTERHLTEAAVMLAYAMHLLETVPLITSVEIHPDGEHGKRFEIARWLLARGFLLDQRHGTTSYCGTYMRGDQSIVVTSIPGKGDVVARGGNELILAECKGGIINTKHAGQTSRLRKGLCEAVGLLLATPRVGRQVAVVPYTEGTMKLAKRLAPRAHNAGIEIALVDDRGQIIVAPTTDA
jgi:hypothetical protein